MQTFNKTESSPQASAKAQLAHYAALWVSAHPEAFASNRPTGRQSKRHVTGER